MTAASAYPPETSEGRPSEPSMEDILASIRRIIADDQTAGAKAAAPVAAPRRAEAGDPARAPARARTPYDDVLDLARLVPPAPRDEPAPEPARAQAVTASAAVQPNVDRAPYQQVSREEAEGRPGSGLRARMPEPESIGRQHDEEHDMLDHSVPALSEEGEDDLMSPPLGESVMSAFETLAATVVLQNTPMLERVMRDLLRPMLKTWLDDNLPSLVERLVRSEIERVARGSRG